MLYFVHNSFRNKVSDYQQSSTQIEGNAELLFGWKFGMLIGAVQVAQHQRDVISHTSSVNSATYLFVLGDSLLYLQVDQELLQGPW